MLDVLTWGREWYWRWRAPVLLGVQGLILHQHRVLLVRHDYGDRQAWQLPGGAVKRRETLTEALEREMKEELNADIHIERVHGVYHNFRRGASDHIIVFVASLKDSASLQPNWEISAFDFFDPNALPAFTSSATRRRIEEYLANASSFEYRPW